MAFCFKRDESVGCAIPRLGCERVKRAIECLKDCARAEAVHNARKEMKKANAVLELARAGIAKKKFRRIGKRLNNAAACLAEARDAAVIAKTLRELMRRSKGRLDLEIFREMRLELQEASRKAAKRLFKNDHVKRTEEILRRVKKNFSELKIEGEDWDVIGRGLERAYEDGRAAYESALTNRSAEHFHEWRKAAKDLWYEVTLLAQVAPEPMERMAGELEELGEALGADHDLFLLQCWIDEQKRKRKPAKPFVLLQQLIEDRQRDLRTRALDIGKHFYAEEPPVFCARIKNFWDLWRDKTPRDQTNS